MDITSYLGHHADFDVHQLENRQNFGGMIEGNVLNSSYWFKLLKFFFLPPIKPTAGQKARKLRGMISLDF